MISIKKVNNRYLWIDSYRFLDGHTAFDYMAQNMKTWNVDSLLVSRIPKRDWKSLTFIRTWQCSANGRSHPEASILSGHQARTDTRGLCGADQIRCRWVHGLIKEPQTILSFMRWTGSAKRSSRSTKRTDNLHVTASDYPNHTTRSIASLAIIQNHTTAPPAITL
jgi:hypothetical protein